MLISGSKQYALNIANQNICISFFFLLWISAYFSRDPENVAIVSNFFPPTVFFFFLSPMSPILAVSWNISQIVTDQSGWPFEKYLFVIRSCSLELVADCIGKNWRTARVIFVLSQQLMLFFYLYLHWPWSPSVIYFSHLISQMSIIDQTPPSSPLLLVHLWSSRHAHFSKRFELCLRRK